MATRVQAILARDVANLGHVGDVVKVAPGFLRNFLLPKRMALPVSKSRLELFEHQKQLVQHQLAKLKATSEEVRDRIEVKKFTIEVKAGEAGKIFGSVGTRDIEKCLKENGFTVHHRDVKLEEGPLKTLGLHEVPVRLEGGVVAKIRVILAAKEEEKVEEENIEEENIEDGAQAKAGSEEEVKASDEQQSEESSKEESAE